MGVAISGAAAGDQLGEYQRLSLDGSTLVAGSPHHDGPAGTNCGSLSVFEFNTTSSTWVQKGASVLGETAEEAAGASVGIAHDASIVVYGGPEFDGSKGVVRAFAWDGDTGAWAQRGSSIEGTAAGDQFGCSVAVSGDGSVLVAGAYGNAGYVRVYEWSEEAAEWQQKGQTIDGNSDRVAQFQTRISMDGSAVAFSARDSSETYVYEWDGSGSWVLKGAAIPFGLLYMDLSADGTHLAVGVDGTDSKGHVYVYKWDTSTSAWVQRGTVLTGDSAGDELSRPALSADGSVLAVGGTRPGGESGRVRVFEWDSDSADWAQRGADLDGVAASDWFGSSVSVSGNGLMVAGGSPGNDDAGIDAGYVRVYYYGTSTDGISFGGSSDGNSTPDTYIPCVYPMHMHPGYMLYMNVIHSYHAYIPCINTICSYINL